MEPHESKWHCLDRQEYIERVAPFRGLFWEFLEDREFQRQKMVDRAAWMAIDRGGHPGAIINASRQVFGREGAEDCSCIALRVAGRKKKTHKTS